jgi:hypothetical protein
MPTYRFLIDGKTIQPGDTIKSFRDELYKFVGTYHPRKICVAGVEDDREHEFFPSVFNGEIQEQHGPNGTWTRTAY